MQRRSIDSLGLGIQDNPFSSLRPTSGTFATIYLLAQACLVLATYQIYLFKLQGVYFSLSTIMSYMILCVTILFILRYRFSLEAFTIIFLTLCIVQAVSGIWSPDTRLMARDLIYNLPFFGVYFLTLIICARRPNAPSGLLWIFSLAAVPNSIMVITFILIPTLENQFLGTGLARFFINPNTLVAIAEGDLGVNVLDPLKSGAFFPNGNMAGVFSEIAFYGGLAASSIYGKIRSGKKAILAIHYVAIICTGSKSAMGLAIIVPITAFILTSILRKSVSKKTIIALAIVLPVAYIIYFIVTGLFISESLAEDGRINFIRRTLIWAFAYEQFLDHPFSGLGYGGWQIAFKGYGDAWLHIGISGDMPPHNTLIVLWAQSGILATLLSIAALVLIFVRSVSCRVVYGPLFSGSCIAAILAFFAHSMTENFTYFNEPHLQAPYAVLFAWITFSAAQPARKPRARPQAARDKGPADGSIRQA